MSTSHFKILLLEGIHPIAQRELESQGFHVDLESTALTESELCERVKGYHAIGIRSKTQITQKVLQASPDLWTVGAFCIGTNQIDLEAANTLGIPAFNAPYSNTRSVAELVIAEMIALSRKLGDCNTAAHKGEWRKSAKEAHEIRGKTLGIVGYGHIGSQVSVLAEALGLRVIYYDIVTKLPLGNSRAMDSLDSLLQESDFVTLHVPETELTKEMMDHSQMTLMKKGSYLINASRGSVVNVEDLAEMISSGHLGGAAVDVFPAEPKNNKEQFSSILQGLPNVILTPHIGGSTEEAQENIGREVAESLSNYLTRGASLGAVNFPSVDPGPLKEGIHLMNIHHNVPGVMSKINSIVSEEGMNILSQHLATDNKIGYLVMRLQGENGAAVAQKVSQLETSIKTRI